VNDTHPFFARRLSLRQLVALDLVAGLCLAFLLFTVMANVVTMPPWMRVALPLALGLPLTLRRVWPMPVFCFTLVLALYTALAGAVGHAYLAPAYALYIVALSDRLGAAVPTSAIAAVSLVTVLGLTVAGTSQTGAPGWVAHLDQPLWGIGALGGAWTIGRAVQERRSYAAREAGRLAAQAVTEERLRLARELHDVVTHNVGLIAIKAGVANHVLASRPQEAHEALRVIETASRSALVEMRHLLGVLRSSEAPERAPAPGPEGIEGLVEQARLAGVEAELDLRFMPDTAPGGSAASSAGDWARLPEGVGLSVYRIVQEALTNVAKHAAPARCRVSVTVDEKEVRIEVLDDGPGRRASPPAEGSGHGLIGMRERVMMYGGTFEAGNRPDRGFRVFATLPYEEVS
jgi:signal transduction histidine kinase